VGNPYSDLTLVQLLQVLHVNAFADLFWLDSILGVFIWFFSTAFSSIGISWLTTTRTSAVSMCFAVIPEEDHRDL
jgi:hypothetical protein